MAHAVRIRGGNKASYANRYIQTYRLQRERAAGFPYFQKVLPSLPTDARHILTHQDLRLDPIRFHMESRQLQWYKRTAGTFCKVRCFRDVEWVLGGEEASYLPASPRLTKVQSMWTLTCICLHAKAFGGIGKYFLLHKSSRFAHAL